MNPLRILHLEDNVRDAELIASLLEQHGLEFEITLVRSRAEFEAALNRQEFDLILSDYSVPAYNGFAALSFTRQHQPNAPFILLSGTLDEEQAVQSLRGGATDYILKQRLARLVPAIRRALDEAAGRAQRRRTEQQLRDQAELLNLTQDAIIVRDMEDRILFWNKGAEALYGWPEAEALGKGFSVLLHSNPELARAARDELLEKGTWSGEMQQATRAGAEISVFSRWSLVLDQNNQPKSILSISTDITEKKRLEARFLRAQRLESVGTLAGGIAHDLNNILSPILLAADLLAETQDAKQRKQILRTIKGSAQRGSDMVRQILSFARGIRGEPQLLDPAQLVQEIERLARETFPRSICIETEIAPSLHPVLGHPTQLHQVLLNLCVNARDAMPDGGTLRLVIENVDLDQHKPINQKTFSGPFVSICVCDTGHGIPPELFNSVFEPFFTTKDVGTGLGLSTVANIVRDHGGEVQLSSDPGQGTTFRLYLPAAMSHAHTAPLPATAPVPPSGQGELILLVDDEIAVREITRLTLETFSYRVLTANDGVQGLNVFKQVRSEIAVVLTDCMMPAMDGPAMIQEMRKIDPAVKTICTTGLGSNYLLGQAVALEGTVSLMKPFSTQKLLATLRQVIEQP